MKTRKYNKKKTMRGGNKTIKIFPDRNTIQNSDDLQNKWEFVIISSHGSILCDYFVTIPENTYVIFNSPSGCGSLSDFGIPYNELLVNDSESDFYINMLNEINNPFNFLKTFTNTTKNNYFPNNIGKNYTFRTLTNENKSLSKKQLSRAIYTPNSITFNMKLTFNNKIIPGILYRGLIMGVHRLPISKDVYNEYRPSITTKFLTDAEVFKHDKNISEVTSKNTNMIPGLVGHDILLSKLFTYLPKIPHGKKRFIFITACRSITLTPEDREFELGLRKLARKYSVSQRENITENSNIYMNGKNASERLKVIPYWKKMDILNTSTMNINIEKLPIRIPNLPEYKL